MNASENKYHKQIWKTCKTNPQTCFKPYVNHETQMSTHISKLMSNHIWMQHLNTICEALLQLDLRRLLQTNLNTNLRTTLRTCPTTHLRTNLQANLNTNLTTYLNTCQNTQFYTHFLHIYRKNNCKHTQSTFVDTIFNTCFNIAWGTPKTRCRIGTETRFQHRAQTTTVHIM